MKRALSLAACLLAAATIHTSPVAKCPPPDCLASVTVVGAAGIPDLVKKSVDNLRFDGRAVAADSATALKSAVAASPRLPAGSVLKLTVSAGTGISGRAAEADIADRIKSLEAALQQAGISANQFTITAH